MSAKNCGSCGATVSPGDRFCPGCGADQSLPTLAAETVVAPATQSGRCPSCSAALRPDSVFCPACGASLQEAGTVPAQASLERLTTDRLVDATTGEFEVLQRIGHGAMGSVYLARDVALSRRVAIKVISPQLLQDETMVARFRLEAQTVAALRHPNIVNLHAVRQLGDLHYFVMDFIDGTSLRAVLKAHAPLQIPVAQALLFQIGSALSYAHRRGRGVIHRDVKPANVMIDREGNAVVMDFGISKVGAAQSGLTQTGATIGTPEYMSPEQCMDKELTGASDQYALGIVAYEMLTGAVPFKGSTYAIMMAHAQGTPPPIREERPDCPPEVEAVVMKMLAKEPSDRFPDLEEAVEALGGKPLGQRDPVRETLVGLVSSVSSDESGLDESSPLSPIPSSRVESGAGREAATTPPPATGATATPAAETVLVSQSELPAAAPAPAPARPDPTPAQAGSPKRGLRWLGAAALIVVALGVARVGLGVRASGPGAEPTGATVEAPPTEPGVQAAAGSAVVDAGGPQEESPANGSGGGAQTAASGPDDAAPAGAEQASPTPPATRPAVEPTRSPPPESAAPVPATVRLGAVAPAMRVGASTPVEAAALGSDGDEIPGAAVQWRSSEPSVATVEGGVLAASAPGRVTISAVAGDATGAVDVTVLAVPSREEVQPILRQFIEPMVRQNIDEVRRRFGAGARGQRQTQLLENMRQASFSAQMTELDEPVPDADGARVDFEVTMRWRGSEGRRTDPRSVWFRAVLLPTVEGWSVEEVTPLQRGS